MEQKVKVQVIENLLSGKSITASIIEAVFKTWRVCSTLNGLCDGYCSSCVDYVASAPEVCALNEFRVAISNTSIANWSEIHSVNEAIEIIKSL